MPRKLSQWMGPILILGALLVFAADIVSLAAMAPGSSITYRTPLTAPVIGHALKQYARSVVTSLRWPITPAVIVLVAIPICAYWCRIGSRGCRRLIIFSVAGLERALRN